MFKDVVIAAMARTPVGSFGGSLKNLSTSELGVIAAKETLNRAGVAPNEVDEVVMGCVGQYGLGSFLGRMVAINSGCPETTTGQTVNRLCASGMQAIVTAATMIDHEDADIVIAGGAENMSNFPYSLPMARWGMRMGNEVIEDTLLTALSEPFTGTHVAITAENIVDKYDLSREELDEYAVMSQERAAIAISEGKFKEEIVPVEILNKKETVIFDTDEYPRATSVDKLAKLRPAFKKDGKITAGNASGINDGAATMLLMSGKTASEKGITPLAKIIDYTVVGVDSNIMGMGPVPATRKLLEKTGLTVKDIDLFEVNEAFAAQALACIKELGLDMSKVNVNGSGISLGHPVGATGAIISIKLISELKRIGGRYGIATLCIGGGQGMAVLYEV